MKIVKMEISKRNEQKNCLICFCKSLQFFFDLNHLYFFSLKIRGFRFTPNIYSAVPVAYSEIMRGGGGKI